MQRIAKLAFGLHATGDGVEALSFKFMPKELGVGGRIVDDQKAHRLLGHFFWWLVGLPMRHNGNICQTFRDRISKGMLKPRRTKCEKKPGSKPALSDEEGAD